MAAKTMDAQGLGQPAGGPLPGVGQGPVGASHEELHPVLQWIVDRFRIIATVLVGIVIIGVVISIYDYQKDAAFYETREELGKILVSTSGDDRIAALEAFLADDPGTFELQARMELVKGLQELGQPERVLEELDAVETTDSGLMVTVAMGKARALNALNRQAEALETLISVRETAPEPFAVPLARAIAAQAEVAENWEVALSAYQDLIDSGMEGDPGFYADKIAQLEELLGRDS